MVLVFLSLVGDEYFMSGAILINSLAIVGALLLILFFKLNEAEDKKHFLLQLLLLGFVLGIIVLAGKTALDYKDDCSWLVNNDTVTGDTTSYNYTYQCHTNENNTASIFYNITVWVMRIVAIYILLYFVYEILVFFGLMGGGKSS